MKNKTAQIFVALALLGGHSAFAKKGEEGGGGGGKYGFGVSADNLVGAGNVAASSLFIINDKTLVQTYLRLGGITPGFTFGLGGTVKLALRGDSHKGLHAGGGFGLGTTGAFFINVLALAGFHMMVVPDLMLNVDVGAQLGVAGGAVNLTLGGTSGFMGISLHYII